MALFDDLQQSNLSGKVCIGASVHPAKCGNYAMGREHAVAMQPVKEDANSELQLCRSAGTARAHSTVWRLTSAVIIAAGQPDKGIATQGKSNHDETYV